jgi:ATP-binding cassette subfamily C (CFTR/MRP) protein 1
MDREKKDLRDLEGALEDPRVETGNEAPQEPIAEDSASSRTDAGSTSPSLGEKNEKLGTDDRDSRPEAHRTLTTTSTLSAVTTNERPALKQSKPWYKEPNPLRWGAMPQVPKDREISHEHGAGFFNQLTFSWMGSLMRVGYRRPLEMDDIWLVNPDRSIDVLADRLQANFDRRAAKNDKHALMWAIFETFKFEFILGGLCSLGSSILQVVTPFVLKYLIQFATDAYLADRGGPPVSKGRGWGLVVGITVMQICQSMCTNHYIYRGFIMGGQARGALITLIFEKAMRISGRAKAGGAAIEDSGSDPEQEAKQREAKQSFIKKMMRKDPNKKDSKKTAPAGKAGVAGDGEGWANGRIVNLMSTDTYRVDQAFGLGLDIACRHHHHPRPAAHQLDLFSFGWVWFVGRRNASSNESHQVSVSPKIQDQQGYGPESLTHPGNSLLCAFRQVLWVGEQLPGQAERDSQARD